MIKDNKMIIVNQKNLKMIKNKGENEEHWTKEKRASLELCMQLASRGPTALGRQVFSTLGVILEKFFENIEKKEKIYKNINIIS